MNKKIINKIPAEVLQIVHRQLDEVTKMLEPHTMTLTQQERQALTGMKSDSMDFLELFHEFSRDFPELFTDYGDVEAFGNEFSITCDFKTLADKLNKLKDSINDTELVASGNAMESANVFFHTVKIAARRDLPCARAIYEELKPVFPSRRCKRPKAS